MKTSIIDISTLLLACVLVFGLLIPTTAWTSEGNIDTNNKYAWAENAGWLNFRSTNGGVTVHDTYLSGYAWAENIGWVKLGSGTGPYSNTTSTNWGVNRDSSPGALSGYAWSENAGWINFNPTNSQVIINTSTGSFDGYAWAENVGWIHFKYDDPAYNVQVAVSNGTYYVDIDPNKGNDSNDGSSLNPWQTLHHAISQINGGAAGTYILIIAAGTYKTGNGEADTALTLSQNDVTIIGAGDASIGASDITVVIDGIGAEGWTKGIEITGSNVTIRGLSITRFSEGIGITAGTENVIRHCKINNNTTGIKIGSDASNYIVRSCEIYGNTDGLTTSGFGTESEMLNNTIHSNTANGINVNSSTPAIKRNELYDCGTGIRVDADGSNASPKIYNNIIYQKTLAYVMNYGILVRGDNDGTASPTIYHNSIDAIGSGDGIAIESGTSNNGTFIKYNIITRCHVFGIDDGVEITGSNIAYNDAWGNGDNAEGNYHNCAAGTGGISEDPKNGSVGPLASDSPCIDVIPTDLDPTDPVNVDYLGYSRPKGSGFDMGAYEYIPTQTYPKALPGGTGLETEYRIFTIPLSIGTGLDMRNTLVGTLGSYDPTHWRVFARTTSGDIEMNSQAFASLDIKPGMGFWLITLYTNAINFTGTLSPDGTYYEMELAPGWHLFAVPWPNTSIELGKIYVTDGVNQYVITNASNTLTEKYIWDYTGTGSTGYTVRNTSDFSLAAGTGYFIKVLGSSNIILSIPPNNTSNPPNSNSASFSPAMNYGFPQSLGFTDDPEPPPLPGGSYGPVPDIRANGKSGSVTVSNGSPVSITVSLDPGDQVDKNADWWIVAHTPFDAPLNWYSYVYPEGWRPGIYPCAQTPLFQVPPSFEVLNMVLSAGDYKFYFALDENADGIVDETWVDSVEVRME